MANQLVFEIIADAQRYVAGLSKADAAATGLDKKNELLARHGVKTSETFREQIIELEYLKQAFKGDEVAVLALDKRIEALTKSIRKLGAEEKEEATDQQQLAKLRIKSTEEIRKQIVQVERLQQAYKGDALATAGLARRKQELQDKLNGVSNATPGASSGILGFGKGINTAALAIKGLIALEAVRYIMDIAQAGVEAGKALSIMQSTVAAANREFGDNVGTVGHWEAQVKSLSAEFEHLSESSIRNAIGRTVDMTKRLGLDSQQMEEVLRRSVDLAAGKTDLASSLERVTSALRGEAESAEMLGLSLSEPALKTWLLSNGFKKQLIPSLTEAQKAQFRYLMFLEQSNEAQGRAIAYNETAAGQLEVLAAKWERTKQSIGGAILSLLEWNGLLDLLQGDVERYGAKIVDAWTFGLTNLTEQVDQARALAGFQADVTSGAFKLLPAHESITGETKKQLTIAEQIELAIKKTTAALTAQGEKRKSLLDIQLEQQRELRLIQAELNGANAAYIGQLLRQNGLLEKQNDERRKAIMMIALPEGVEAFRVPGISPGEAWAQGDAFTPPAQRNASTIDPTTGKPWPKRKADPKKAPGAVIDIEEPKFESQVKDWAPEIEGVQSYAEAHKMAMDTVYQVSAGVFGGLADLAGAAFDASGEKAKGFFKLYKAMAIAEAGIATYESAVNAYKATVGIPIVGPALAPVAAAAAVAFGLANIARIASMEPGGGAGGGAAAGGAAAKTGVPVAAFGMGAGALGASGPALARGGPTPGVIVSAGANQSGTLQTAVALEKATRSLDRAVRKMPDRLSVDLRGDVINIATARASEKQAAALGEFA